MSGPPDSTSLGYVHVEAPLLRLRKRPFVVIHVIQVMRQEKPRLSQCICWAEVDRKLDRLVTSFHKQDSLLLGYRLVGV
jgi:hypothetical protein